MSKNPYSLTPEHKEMLPSWRDKWIANAMSTSPMTGEDREITRKSILGMYAAAKLPPPKAIVFVPSPFVLRFASGAAAWEWYLQENKGATNKEATVAVTSTINIATQEATQEATRDATEGATHRATYEATDEAINMATQEATREATQEATRRAIQVVTYAAIQVATEEATRDATDEATRDATRDATEAATREATYEATRRAIQVATRGATDEATRDATDDATYEATYDATYEAITRATYEATRDATRRATEAATDEATEEATRRAIQVATRGATDEATYVATDEATYEATRRATYAATRDATRRATEAATDEATYEATRRATYAATRDATRRATEAATREATEEATRRAIQVATRGATDEATRDATDDATYEATYDATYEAITRATYEATDVATRDATREAVKPHVLDLSKWYVYDIDTSKRSVGDLKCAASVWKMWQGGNQWSAYDSFLSFFDRVVGLDLPEYEAWRHWEQASLHSGPRTVHKDFCMVSDRPEILLVDDRNRPHCSNGPFCKWRDGSALYAVHGVRVPAWVIEKPSDITVPYIDNEQNAEVRRVMLNLYGVDKYIRNSHITEMGQDEWGTLYKKDIPNDEPIVMVRYLNSSLEPDGSRKEYWHRVHPELRPLHPDGTFGEPQEMTAHNAIASTFGLRGSEYYPTIET